MPRSVFSIGLSGALVTSATLGSSACSLVASFEERPQTIAPPAAICPEEMAPVPVPGGDGYCIDRTEVTVEAYSEFLGAEVTVASAGLDARCDSKKSFDPGINAALGCSDEVVDPALRALYPMVCVDFCDALAYCAWSGKHLCGKIVSDGEDAQAIDVDEFADPAKDEWYNACSKGGTLAWPYAPTFDLKACRVDVDGVDKAGEAATCEGGYPGILDMSGNANEWENSCQTDGGEEYCRTRGGAFYYMNKEGYKEPALRCDNSKLTLAPITHFSDALGFRCCK